MFDFIKTCPRVSHVEFRFSEEWRVTATGLDIQFPTVTALVSMTMLPEVDLGNMLNVAECFPSLENVGFLSSDGSVETTNTEPVDFPKLKNVTMMLDDEVDEDGQKHVL